MKPAFVIDSLKEGGAEGVVKRLAFGLAQRGHQPAIYCLKQPGIPLKPFFDAGIAVRAANSRGRDPLLWWRLARWLRADRVDLVAAHSSAALCAIWPVAKALRRPIVHVRHGWLTGPENRYSRLAQRLSPLVEQTVIVAESLRPRLRPQPVQSRALHIPDGIDAVPADRRDAQEHLATLCGRSLPRPVIMSIGNLKPEKDILGLVRAFKQVGTTHPTASLVCVGATADAAYAHAVKQLIQTLNLAESVFLVGGVPRAQALLPAADVFCLSSATEAHPNVLLEAMAQRVPIVATGVGDVGPDGGAPRDADILVDAEHGLIVPPRNPAGLAAAISDVLARPTEAHRRAAAAEQRFRARYTSVQMVSRYEQLYQRLTNRRATRGRSRQQHNHRSILVLGPHPQQVGGMVTAIKLTLASPLRHAHHMQWFAPRPRSVERESEDRPRWRRTLASALRHFRDLQRLTQALRRPDVSLLHIHTCSYFSFFRNALDMLAAKLLRKPVVLHIHGNRFEEFCRASGPLRRRFIQRALESADAVVVLAHQWYVRLKPYAGRARLVVVPNCYDPAMRAPAAKRSQPGAPTRFLHLGAVRDAKGIRELIEASGLLARRGIDFETAIVGPVEPADLERYRALAASCGVVDRVKFVEPVHGSAKQAVLSAADVFVQASHSEGLSIALLEAAAAGLPIIATRVGATAEALTPATAKTGNTDPRPVAPLVQPGNVVALAGAMTKLASEPKTRDQIAAAVHAHICSEYSPQRMAERMTLVYDSILGQRAAADIPHPPRDADTPSPARGTFYATAAATRGAVSAVAPASVTT